MSNPRTSLGRKRAIGPPRSRPDTPTPLPTRQQGLWNFLTWSFFISQVLAAESFVGGSAHAAGDTESAPSSGGSSAAQAQAGLTRSPNDMLAREPGDTQAAAQGSESHPAALLHAMGGQPSHASAATDASDTGAAGAADHATAADAGSAGGELLLRAANSESLADLQAATLDQTVGSTADTLGDVVGSLGGAVGNSVSPVLGAVGDIVGTIGDLFGSLDATLDHALSPVLGAVGGVVGSVEQLVEHAVAPVIAAVGNVVGSLETILEQAAAPLGDLLGSLDIIGSEGSILVPETPPLGKLHLDDLFSNGSYTPYNLAMNLGQAPSPTANASLPIIDNLLADLHAGSSTDDHHNNATPAHGALTPILDDLHLRGLGDGIGL
jgi:hypothetical protein